MLEQFGEDDGEHFRAVMTGCTGMGVYLMILGMAVYMIYTSGKKKIWKGTFLKRYGGCTKMRPPFSAPGRGRNGKYIDFSNEFAII